MLKRLVSISVLILIIVLGYLQKDDLVHLIKQGGTVSIFISMLLVAICVFFPLIPFPVLAGMIGAIFGTAQGMFISLIGAMAGTIVFFFITRYGFRDYAQEKLLKYPKFQEYEKFLNRNSFLAILACRLVPIIPAPVVNIICGLSKVNWLIFFTASTIGKIPNILLLSFVGATLSSNKLLSFGLYGFYILVIFLINFVIVYRKKAKTLK
ncbi:TVP38/TMEM64 family protein [Bacillus salipaludis]|uniref:TVP38/TMEM64 family membrane protein n=1 Tax=Bacillus salipaludis TaxID=2547811 RepID=A0A4R5VVI3_9BACI|nr:TVP38/TMEM64 family protein [Bacillus salipaludis]MDQ6597348.1 TVP38/TMEM64 family protein [Bacillus salipaludis]TDK63219.1 TVP38/TMEM64 family protein [Bacillus salipaludis]